MSASVTTPTTRPAALTTGSPEMRASASVRATSFSGVSKPTVFTSCVITSLTFMVLLLPPCGADALDLLERDRKLDVDPRTGLAALEADRVGGLGERPDVVVADVPPPPGDSLREDSAHGFRVVRRAASSIGAAAEGIAGKPQGSASERPQRVQDDAHVHGLLEEGSVDGRQVAGGGRSHREQREPDPGQHALPGDAER